ncbi:MAG: hypothetical protein NTW19_24830 [Planctomycetota bacterium]|nr:hypothetical protein [Planctomycetota bacterium]
MTTVTAPIAARLQPPVAAADAFGYLPRSRWMPLAFALPAAICGLSWAADGETSITDAGMLLLTVLCIFYFILEVFCFPKRFGIGGMLVFGGTLVWFCHDYLTHWYGTDPALQGDGFTSATLAKAGFYYSLWVMLMTIGLLVPVHRWATKPLSVVPETGSDGFYFIIIIACFILGLFPYMFLAVEPMHLAIYHQMTGGRNFSTEWIVGRSGNANYNWGAYFTLFFDAAMGGVQVAAFYAFFFRASLARKLVCWAIWFFWLAMNVGTGTRGLVVAMVVPVMAMIFLKYQARAAAMRVIVKRAYIYTGIVALLLLLLVQMQIKYRNTGFNNFSVNDAVENKVAGNMMFSEGLTAMQLVPSQHDFFSDLFPGAKFILPIPDLAYRLLITPIPRALWHDKPIAPDRSFAWYNLMVTGGTGDGVEGTTCSASVVGQFYMNYGIWGVIQGGLLMGWIIRVVEKGLQEAQGRPMTIILSLGAAAWLFRCFRTLNFNNIIGLILFAMLLAVVSAAYKQFFVTGGSNESPGGLVDVRR